MEFLRKDATCQSSSVCQQAVRLLGALQLVVLPFSKARGGEQPAQDFCAVTAVGAHRDLLASAVRTWLLSLALNVLVTVTGVGRIQNGPRPELVQIP